MREWTTKELSVLEAAQSLRTELPAAFRASAAPAVRRVHAGVPGYAVTPLVGLPALAESLGVRGVYAKDESKRFSLNAFKGLGGSYAMFRILCERLSLDPEKTTPAELMTPEAREKLRSIEFATCTDGNHGRGVSWAAGIFGCRAHVFMPCGTEEVRAEAIRRVGPAEVTVTDLSYDDTVRLTRTLAEEKGWVLIQDTSWDGYETVPTWIIQGYLSMAAEAAEQLDALSLRPTHVFLQAGVGSMAGGVLAFLADRYGEHKPIAVIVEPYAANCVYVSAKAGDGRPRSVEGIAHTMMAGLNCGTPCGLIWPILRDWAEFFVSCDDCVSAEGMRAYAAGLDGDPSVVSGESGAATLGAALRILTDEALSDARSAMKLDADSVILLFSTEGDTDPENYRRIVRSVGAPAP